MADLTPEQILLLRRAYIRDRAFPGVEADPLADPPVEAAPAEYLSAFNVSRGVEFFTDAELESLHDAAETVYREELAAVWESKYSERLAYGDGEAEAVAAADAVKESATLRLVRAEALERMMMDPGYIASVAEATRMAVFDTWRRQIQNDRQFYRAQGGGFASVPFHRA
jgi:hypothetical protein